MAISYPQPVSPKASDAVIPFRHYLDEINLDYDVICRAETTPVGEFLLIRIQRRELVGDAWHPKIKMKVLERLIGPPQLDSFIEVAAHGWELTEAGKLHCDEIIYSWRCAQ